MLRRLYDWTMGLAAHRHATVWLAAISLPHQAAYSGNGTVCHFHILQTHIADGRRTTRSTKQTDRIATSGEANVAVAMTAVPPQRWH